ncbi:hypothetical protein HY745_14015 [Candidatus Desantisbacteria bacterium]|nr:hypothetical protein [Candidatus Desantisbacteria bacterium]
METKMLDFSKIKTYPIKDRKNKTSVKDFSKVCGINPSFQEFIDSLPYIFAGENFRQLVADIVHAHKNRRSVIFMMGAHVIKCGLSPLIIDLMKNGILSCVALNGAGAIHDFEIAMIGGTSEDVAHNLEDGSFGMAEETGFNINNALKSGVKKGLGAGKALGEKICKDKYPYREMSILFAGVKYNIPVTVHIAIGTDIIHQHPKAEGKVLGEASYIDFKTFASCLVNLEGGVVINFGSSVMLPEVFLKAITITRNLGIKINKFTAANFDMIRHYRPEVNVLSRPTAYGGKGYYFCGYHEIMIPLLVNAVNVKMGI